jgi:hypothetical protein
VLNLQSKLKEFAQTFNIPLRAVYGGLIFIVLFTSLVFARAAVQNDQDLRKEAVRFETRCGWCGNTCMNMAGEIDLRCPGVEPPPGCVCKKNDQGVCQSSCSSPNIPNPSLTPTNNTPTPTQGERDECLQAGESYNRSLGPNDPNYGLECCKGLEPLPPERAYDEDCNYNNLVGYAVTCSDCGNGTCEKWENKCSCPEDCPSESPVIDPDVQQCRQAGGEWTQFPNGCVDSCAYAANPQMMCATVLTTSCECGPDHCWNGNTCLPNPTPTSPPTSPTICPQYQSDFNDDCSVDHADYYILLNEIYADNPNPDQDIASEYNHEAVSQPDGRVDVWDYTMLIKQWRQSQN